MGHDADWAADLAATYIPGQDPELDREMAEAERHWDAVYAQEDREQEAERVSTQADDIIDNNGHGFDLSPNEPEPDDVFDGPGTAFAEPASAADMAMSMTERVQAALQRARHLPCDLAQFAAMTSDDSGAVVAVCGCGEFFPLEGLVDGARTLSDAEVQVRPGNTVTVHAADPIARQAALIPQGVHLTPEMLEQNILDVLERLEKGGAFERMCIEQEAAAKTAYTIAYARAFNQATGPVEVRNQAAIEETIPELEARDEATMIRKAVQASLHTLRSVLSGYQTVNGNVRAAMNAGGSPGRG